MTASRVLTCLRCGHEGTDVRAKLVDLEDEALAEGGRIRSVESTGGTHRPVPTPDDPRPRSLAGVDPAAVFPAAPEETEEADPWL